MYREELSEMILRDDCVLHQIAEPVPEPSRIEEPKPVKKAETKTRMEGDDSDSSDEVK